jgi:outer membrane protein assembly factor BamD (BamD/ComL family)
VESTWKLVQDSKNPEDLRYFLEQFPDSPYAVPAKLKLKQLKRENER